TGKVPVVSPPGITMDGGTVTLPLLLDRLMSTPAAGAGEARTTVPVALPPDFTGFGEMVMLPIWPWPASGGATSRLVPTESREVAVSLAVTGAATTDVEMFTEAEVPPDGIRMLAGIVAALLSELKVTLAPLAGAGAARATVPVAPSPPARL